MKDQEIYKIMRQHNIPSAAWQQTFEAMTALLFECAPWTPLRDSSEFCPCTNDECVVQLHVEENGSILVLEDDSQGVRLSFLLGDDWRLCRKDQQ